MTEDEMTQAWVEGYVRMQRLCLESEERFRQKELAEAIELGKVSAEVPRRDVNGTYDPSAVRTRQ